MAEIDFQSPTVIRPRRLLRGFLPGGPVYVRIRASQLWVRDVRTGIEFRDEPVMVADETSVIGIGTKARRESEGNSNLRLINGFEHPRTVIADFQMASKILSHALHLVLDNGWLRPSVIIIFHPLEKLEGGLTPVEHRAFVELASAVGGRGGYVWSGRELTDSEILAPGFVAQLKADV